MRKILPIILLSNLFLIQSCMVWKGDKKLTLNSIKTSTSGKFISTLTNFDVANNQITLNGSGFSKASVLKIKINGALNNLNIVSQSDTQIIASATSALSFLIGGAFDLIIGTASATTTYTITFTLQDGAVLARNLDSMSASPGQILKYTASGWAPGSLASSQVYVGTWDPTGADTRSATHSGEYYIATANGGADAYSIGDWSMFNGVSYDKISTNIDTKLPLIGGTLTGDLILNTLAKFKSGSNYITVKANSALSSNVNFILPATEGTSGQFLTTDGLGSTSWATVTTSGGSVTSVSSANSDLSIINGTSTPTITLNAGTAANQIVKLNGSAQLPAVSGNLLTSLNASNLSGVVPVANGGTGSATQNFVDLTSGQTIAGIKTFSSTIVGNISGNAATVTTNANLTGAITSVGNATSISNGAVDLTTKVTGTLPIANGGTGASTLGTAQSALGISVSGATTGAGAAVGSGGIQSNKFCLADTIGGRISCINATSSLLAGSISDASGTGALLFGTSPTLSNPVITNIAPAADFTLTQNTVIPFTSVNTGAVANTLYLKAGQVGIGTTTPGYKLDVTGDVNVSGALRVNGTAISTTTVSPATVAPLIDATTAVVGTSLLYSRQDHVHPTDTTRSPAAGSASITTLGTITSGTWNGTTIAIANGGTGSTTQNFVDLTAAQTIAGVKTFSATIAGSITGNAATVTTNADMTGDVTSSGSNATTVKGINGTLLSGLATGILKNTTTTGAPSIAVAGTDYLSPTGSGASLTGIVDLTTAQTITGAKTFGDGKLLLQGATSGATTVKANAIAGAYVITLPAATGTLALTSNITGTNSGTNTGDQTITLTGPVTGSGTGTFATTITNASIDLTTKVTGALPVANGGTGLTAGVSGSIPYYSSTTALTSSALLGLNGIMIGGGAGGAPSTLANGTSGQYLKSAGAASPTWSDFAPDVRASSLTGLVAGTGSITSADTVLTAMNKLAFVDSDYISKSATSAVNGTLAINTLTGNLTVPYAPYGANSAVNQQYVLDLLGKSGAVTVASTGSLISNTATSSTASINKIGMDIESTGAWTGSPAVNTGLVVNVSGGTTNYAATFMGGNVGIGTTTPGAMLDIAQAGGAAGTKSAISLRAGNNSNYFGNNQILLGYSGTQTYQHDIKTRHNSAAATGNDIDFYVWNYGVDTISDVGSKQVMTLDGTGNVGIGTTAPTTPLYITSPATSGTARSILTLNTGESQTNTSGYLDFAQGGIVTGRISNVYEAGSKIGLGFSVWNTGLYEAVRISNTGSVGIGTPNPGAALEIDSGINGAGVLRMRNTNQAAGRYWNFGPDGNNALVAYNESNTGLYIAYNQTSWSINSDRRLKKYIAPIENSLNKLLQITGMTYLYNKDSETAQRRVGVIAQDVQKVLPEAVTKKDGFLGVKYTELIPLVINAVKEVYHQWFDDSRAIHKELEEKDKKIAELEERLARVEQAVLMSTK